MGKDTGSGPKAGDSRTLDRIRQFKWQMAQNLATNDTDGVTKQITDLTYNMFETVEQNTLYEEV